MVTIQSPYSAKERYGSIAVSLTVAFWDFYGKSQVTHYNRNTNTKSLNHLQFIGHFKVVVYSKIHIVQHDKQYHEKAIFNSFLGK